MINGILYQTADGLIVSVIIGPADAVGEQSPPGGYAYAQVLGGLGQYYDAATGLVSDTTPVPSTG